MDPFLFFFTRYVALQKSSSTCYPAAMNIYDNVACAHENVYSLIYIAINNYSKDPPKVASSIHVGE
jgi:hypothetical protein